MIGMVKGVKSTLSQVKATLKTKSQNLHAPIALITKDHSWVSLLRAVLTVYSKI